MPLIEVKAVDRRFDDPAVNERLIATLTDAAPVVGRGGAPRSGWSWRVPATRWGIGGKPLS